MGAGAQRLDAWMAQHERHDKVPLLDAFSRPVSRPIDVLAKQGVLHQTERCPEPLAVAEHLQELRHAPGLSADDQHPGIHAGHGEAPRRDRVRLLHRAKSGRELSGRQFHGRSLQQRDP
jgi:hypothetical protein